MFLENLRINRITILIILSLQRRNLTEEKKPAKSELNTSGSTPLVATAAVAPASEPSNNGSSKQHKQPAEVSPFTTWDDHLLKEPSHLNLPIKNLYLGKINV